MEPSNFLFLFSDEHRQSTLGCYGSPTVKTPNLDSLAARGTRFENAYTPSPICVPARGSLATGKWAHQGPYWDNIFSYHGECPSWHHRIRDNGHDMAVTGKLHYRSVEDDNGFTEEIDTMHMMSGVGDLIGSIRKPPPPPRLGMPILAAGTGPGDCTYNEYDQRVADAAIQWIEQRTRTGDERPWSFMVSFARPHYPLTCPREFYDMYDPRTIELPSHYAGNNPARHPWIEELAKTINYGDHFRDEDHIREGIASYYALVTFMDHQLGRVLAALDETGCTDTTRVLYSSDHGDNISSRGLWGKSTMYEESCAVPLIMAGPDIPAGHVVKTSVSLIDIYPTAIASLGYDLTEEEQALPCRSLYDFIEREEPDRTVFSEYHAMGSSHASFMVRFGDWKYIYYVTFEPELFNLADDPEETRNLAGNPDFAEIEHECERRLRAICDPEAVDEQAHTDQKARLAEHGGPEAILGRGDGLYTPVPGESDMTSQMGVLEKPGE